MRFLTMAILLSTFFYGCGESAFSTEKATIIAYNVSGDNIIALVNSEEFPLAPNSSFRFTVEIQVPTPRNTGRGLGQFAPSQLDRTVEITVSFKNSWTGVITPPISCQAGAKVVTNIIYEVRQGSPQPRTRCDTSR